MDELEDAVWERASRIFRTRQGAQAFMRLRSPKLGGSSPMELLAAGRAAEVLDFLNRLEAEAPAPGPSIFGIPWSGLGRRR